MTDRKKSSEEQKGNQDYELYFLGHRYYRCESCGESFASKVEEIIGHYEVSGHLRISRLIGGEDVIHPCRDGKLGIACETECKETRRAVIGTGGRLVDPESKPLIRSIREKWDREWIPTKTG